MERQPGEGLAKKRTWEAGPVEHQRGEKLAKQRGSGEARPESMKREWQNIAELYLEQLRGIPPCVPEEDLIQQ